VGAPGRRSPDHPAAAGQVGAWAMGAWWWVAHAAGAQLANQVCRSALACSWQATGVPAAGILRLLARRRGRAGRGAHLLQKVLRTTGEPCSRVPPAQVVGQGFLDEGLAGAVAHAAHVPVWQRGACHDGRRRLAALGSGGHAVRTSLAVIICLLRRVHGSGTGLGRQKECRCLAQG
jgi:hypothetical protein